MGDVGQGLSLCCAEMSGYQWLAHLPLVLEVQGLIPLAARKISVSEHAFLSVICRNDT